MKFIAIDSVGFTTEVDEIKKAFSFIEEVDKDADKYIFSDYKNGVCYVGGLNEVKPYAIAAYLDYRKEQCELDDLVDDLAEFIQEFDVRLRNAERRECSLSFQRYRYEIFKV